MHARITSLEREARLTTHNNNNLYYNKCCLQVTVANVLNMVCLVTSLYIPPYGERLPPKPFSYQYVVNGSLSRTEVSFPDIRVVESRHTADHRQG